MSEFTKENFKILSERLLVLTKENESLEAKNEKLFGCNEELMIQIAELNKELTVTKNSKIPEEPEQSAWEKQYELMHGKKPSRTVVKVITPGQGADIARTNTQRKTVQNHTENVKQIAVHRPDPKQVVDKTSNTTTFDPIVPKSGDEAINDLTTNNQNKIQNV